jgi:hypothetical protein
MHAVCGVLCNLTNKHEGNRAAIASRTSSCSLLLRMLKRLVLLDGDGLAGRDGAVDATLSDAARGLDVHADAKTGTSSVVIAEGVVAGAAEGKDGDEGQGNADADVAKPCSPANIPNKLKELDASGMRTVQWLCAVLRIVCIGVPENQATFGNINGCDLVMRCKHICMHIRVCMHTYAYTHPFVS